MSDRRWRKAIGLVLAAGLLLAACGGSNNSSGGTKKYVVGISNTLTGNGFREEMICSIKAQAKASGIVSKVIVANRNTDPSGQIADMRNLISSLRGEHTILLSTHILTEIERNTQATLKVLEHLKKRRAAKGGAQA